MAIFLHGNSDAPSASVTVQLLQSASQTEVVADSAMLDGNVLESELDQRYLHLGGGQLIELHENPLIKYNLVDFTINVPSWGVTVKFDDLPRVPRLMAREFMRLLHKAEIQDQSAEEKERWLAMSDQVNYARFSRERAAPRYVEGVLIRRNGECYVEWHDGRREWVPNDIAAKLNLVEPGERFGAFINFAINGNTTLIERVSLLGPAQAEQEDAWDKWPPTIS